MNLRPHTLQHIVARSGTNTQKFLPLYTQESFCLPPWWEKSREKI